MYISNTAILCIFGFNIVLMLGVVIFGFSIVK